MNSKSINGLQNEVDNDIPGFEEYDIITGNDIGLSANKDFQQFSKYTPLDAADTVTRIPLTHKYEDEWSALFGKSDIDLADLKQRALDGDLRSSHFRSICWRCLLGVLDTDPQQWVYQLETYRKHYNDVRKELETNPWNAQKQIPLDNPLSQESESIWQKYFSDQELRSVIFQDVTRTFPGLDFFRKSSIQELMIRVLFCYARQNPVLCYRQGMHEILAPIVFILHCDHEAFLQAKDISEMTASAEVILNPECLEEDVYTVFKQMMGHIESSYRISNLVPTPAGYFPNTIQAYGSPQQACENEVLNRLESIRNTILMATDPELTNHLKNLDIPLQLFGIRWLRLLFGREFPLHDLLVLWDAIFAEGFELVDYIVVAMLTAIRQYLLQSDYTSCLTCLMRYPGGIDIGLIISNALHLKDPITYPSAISPPTIPLPRPVPPRSNQGKLKAQTESLEVSLFRAKRVKNIPTPPRPTHWMRARPSPVVLNRSGEGDASIVEGFTVDDPSLIAAELEHARAVMSLVRLKLNQYHNTLATTLTQPLSGDAQQALDGIHELCYLLKTHQAAITPDIEPAAEAGETNTAPKTRKPFGGSEKTSSAEVSQKSHTLPKVAKKPVSSALKVFKETQGGPIQGAPMEDPLRLIKSMCHEDEDLYRLLKDLNKPDMEANNKNNK